MIRTIFLSIALACGLALAGEQQLGKPLTLKQTTGIEALLASPEKFNGRTVQVKGKVTEVCENMGCWMKLVDTASGKSVRIKVKDGEIVFPKSAIGKMASAEGKFAKAGESWQVQGTGAVIYE